MFRNPRQNEGDWNLEDLWTNFEEIMNIKAEVICVNKQINKNRNKTRKMKKCRRNEKREEWKQYKKIKPNEDYENNIRLRNTVKNQSEKLKGRGREEIDSDKKLGQKLFDRN